MEKELFSPMEIDALGEMMNISLGSSATAVSNLLDHRVDITTPKVTVVPTEDFTIGNLEPAMGVEIKYVEGLEGSNIMLLRRRDIKVIVDILMGSETPDEEFELNDLTISAVCEVMNQMMGAAATAMSDFLGFPVDISTPKPFELEDLQAFKDNHLPKGEDTLVVVRFALKIEDALESEFMNVITVKLAKELLKGLGLGEDDGEEPAAAPAPAPEPEPAGGSNRMMSQEEIERMMSGGAPEPEPEPEPAGGSNRMMSQEEIERLMSGGGAPEPEPEPEPAGGSNRMMSQEEIERMLAGGGASEPAPAPAPSSPPPAPAPAPAPAQTAPPPPQPASAPAAPAAQPAAAADMGSMMAAMMAAMTTVMANNNAAAAAVQQPAEPKVIATKPVPMKELNVEEVLGKEQAQNLDLIMEVPLQVSVEIGRTQRKVQEILGFSKGSLVVLDKLAGDQVDLFVNGKCIARGDVVVIDDNFGVRVTEIVQNPDFELPKKK
nr:flagellar motor switch protein FliN [uncultured Oscillibacter sp.]